MVKTAPKPEIMLPETLKTLKSLLVVLKDAGKDLVAGTISADGGISFSLAPLPGTYSAVVSPLDNEPKSFDEIPVDPNQMFGEQYRKYVEEQLKKENDDFQSVANLKLDNGREFDQ